MNFQCQQLAPSVGTLKKKTHFFKHKMPMAFTISFIIVTQDLNVVVPLDPLKMLAPIIPRMTDIKLKMNQLRSLRTCISGKNNQNMLSTTNDSSYNNSQRSFAQLSDHTSKMNKPTMSTFAQITDISLKRLQLVDLIRDNAMMISDDMINGVKVLAVTIIKGILRQKKGSKK